MEKYIRQGFSYKTMLKTKGSLSVKEITIFYQEIDIYFQVVNIRVECDALFKNICENYINDFLS